MLVFTFNLRWLIIWSLAAGGALCLLYDVIRATRVLFGISPAVGVMRADKLFVLKVIYLFISDFAFCIVCAVTFLLLAYYTNGGLVRGLSLASAAVGFVLIRLTVSRLFTFLLFKAVLGVRWLLRKMVKPLFLLYHLTLGKIICIIKEKSKSRRERKRAERELRAHGKEKDVAVEEALAQNNRKERIVIRRRAPKL